jgi:hypothetical protein
MALYRIGRVISPKYPAIPPGFTVNNGRRPFEFRRGAPDADRLDDSLELPMLDMLPSSFVDVASTSYRESTVGVDCLALGAFSGSDCSSVGSTMSKNPSITKKSPEPIGSEKESILTETYLYLALRPLLDMILLRKTRFRPHYRVHSRIRLR